MPVTTQEINAWVNEIDPKATVGGGGGSSASTDFFEQELNLTVAINNSKSEELLTHLRLRLSEFIEESSWIITKAGTSEDQFSMVLVKGHSQYRLYVWIVPPSKIDREQAEKNGQKAVRLKIVTIGHTTGGAR